MGHTNRDTGGSVVGGVQNAQNFGADRRTGELVGVMVEWMVAGGGGWVGGSFAQVVQGVKLGLRLR